MTYHEQIFICSLAIPEGYEVESLPENKIMVLPGNAGKSIFNFSQLGNKITITTVISINKTYFPITDYANLREFYARFIAKLNEPVVIKKRL